MTVAQLREMLSEAQPTDIVQIYDPNAEDWMPVTGMTYGGAAGIVKLYSDKD